MGAIRIISNNAADSATITAASTADGMGTDKLKTDIKGDACRVLAGSATIVLTWPALETVGAVVIPASNLGASSTIRVRAYLDAAGATLLADTGARWAAPGTTLEGWGFTQPLNVNAFSEGNAPITACYLPEHVAARRLVIDITNPGNQFIDISRLVVGSYHALQYGAPYGATVGTADMTKNTRAASGDIKSDWGPRATTLQFDLEWVSPVDRARVRQLLARGVGSYLFISLLPEHPDPILERDASIYGKPAQPGSMAFAFYQNYSTQIQIEGF